jgi:hypothetical protein
MTEHGITTTKADYWLHLFPLLRRVFWYRVEHCRAYIAQRKPVETIGRSKDGTPTGGGYLIPQDTYFVRSETIPPSYIEHADWPSLTDSEAGLIGQEIGFVLIEHRVVIFPAAYVTALNSRQAQLAATDCQVSWMPKRITVEIKTERLTTRNLFVQRSERGHRVHLTKSGELRVTTSPSLFGESDP